MNLHIPRSLCMSWRYTLPSLKITHSFRPRITNQLPSEAKQETNMRSQLDTIYDSWKWQSQEWILHALIVNSSNYILFKTPHQPNKSGLEVKSALRATSLRLLLGLHLFRSSLSKLLQKAWHLFKSEAMLWKSLGYSRPLDNTG